MKINKKNYHGFFNLQTLLVFFIVAVGVLLRFYNLNWGAPFYFHPDERNIAGSISQLVFPGQLNPHFFAYGSLPIYSVFFLGLLQKLQGAQVSFENAIVIGRILSAILSLGVLFLIYKTTYLLGGKKSGIIGLCLAALSVGYIQYAHFSTFEMWLSFLTLLLTYSILQYSRSRKNILCAIIAVELGLLTSVKISSLIFLPLSLGIILWIDFLHRNKSKPITFLRIEKIVFKVILFLGICVTTVFITSPFFWFDNNSFRSSIMYEVNVATGKVPVFYTQGFIHAVPILDPILKTYPFLLNPFVEIIFIVLLPSFFFYIVKKRNIQLFIVLLFFCISFFSQAVLYVQWTRYYVPTLGFIYILLGHSIGQLISSKKSLYKNLGYTVLLVLFASSFLYTYFYTRTVLFRKDSRVEAATWASKNIPQNAFILSEVYDMGIVPFNSSFHNIQLFNFYELENDSLLPKLLQETLIKTRYVILPSERVINTRISNKKSFPYGFAFYNNLQNKNAYKKSYETSCDIFCKIVYLKNPWYNLEETTNVFDRPTVTIYKRI